MQTAQEAAAWRKKADSSDRPLLGAAVGDAASAREMEGRGADFLVALGTGPVRTPAADGAEALLPLADANARVLERAAELFSEPRRVPLLAALCGTDPLRLMERFLEDLRNAGYAGILNWPSVGLIDGAFRAGLEAAHLGYDREVQAVRTAAGSGLLAAACVFSPDQAVAMAQVGAEVLVVHPGLGTRPPEEIHRRVREIAHAAREARAGAIVLAHAGPLRTLDDFEALWTQAAELDGFFEGGLFGKQGRPRPEEVALLRRPRGRGPLTAAREV